jgi:hypothetical protein
MFGFSTTGMPTTMLKQVSFLGDLILVLRNGCRKYSSVGWYRAWQTWHQCGSSKTYNGIQSWISLWQRAFPTDCNRNWGRRRTLKIGCNQPGLQRTDGQFRSMATLWGMSEDKTMLGSLLSWTQTSLRSINSEGTTTVQFDDAQRATNKQTQTSAWSIAWGTAAGLLLFTFLTCHSLSFFCPAHSFLRSLHIPLEEQQATIL